MGIDHEIDVQGFQFKKTFSTHAGAGLHYIFFSIIITFKIHSEIGIP
jgi:hypothetical protein